MDGATWNSCRLRTSSVYTIQPCTSSQGHFIPIHKFEPSACNFGTTILFTCHWGNRGWNGYWDESAQKADTGEENSPAAPAGLKLMTLSITSLGLYPWVNPFPQRLVWLYKVSPSGYQLRLCSLMARLRNTKGYLLRSWIYRISPYGYQTEAILCDAECKTKRYPSKSFTYMKRPMVTSWGHSLWCSVQRTERITSWGHVSSP